MPYILDQYGQPVLISQQRQDFDFDLDYGAARSVTASLAQELRADREARLMAEEPAEEDTASPAEHERACAAARSAGHFEGIAEGKKVGAKAEGRRFMDVVRGCNGNDAKLLAALNLAVEFPEIPAAGCVDMAGKHFTNHRRGSASLALRHTQPDSLALALAQLAGA
ncbi:hypothetical protein EB230_23460 [Mesorhizobium sp. NZP2234]|uniref:hypothetical protein n=1 Tax=Mesorhizobium sp. NZP2234 TaxID=2483402 RepID=UPI001554627B|nr:hypothetical protein [Mesorhizobium sp. NZP2234]QKC91033.1 hypothetical protein EB230_23460 [Mesorhizobium sp. NZP2234]